MSSEDYLQTKDRSRRRKSKGDGPENEKVKRLLSTSDDLTIEDAAFLVMHGVPEDEAFEALFKNEIATGLMWKE